MAAISRIAVMEGTLDEVSLVELLQVISIGRQYTVIELRRPDETSAGTLFVKAGKLIACASAEARGKEAFFRLVPSSPAVSFHVFRTETPRSLPEPVGALGTLLLEALERGAIALPAQAGASTTGASPSNDRPQQVSKATVRVESQPISAPHPAAQSRRPVQRAESQPVQQQPDPRASSGAPPAQSRRPVQRVESQPIARVSGPAQAGPTPEQQRAPVAVAPIRDASQQRPVSPSNVARHVAAATAQPTKEAPRPAPDAQAAQSSPTATAARPVQPVQSTPQARGEAPPRQEQAAERPRDRERPHRQVSGEVPVAQKPPFVVALASPKGGCGKTTLALNLALTLARQNRRVILVDADINGDIASAIDARSRARAGTFDVLTGQATVDDALLSTVIPDFKIMPASGPSPVDPGLLLSDTTEAWRALLDELASRTDIVLVDAPAGMLGATQPILRAVSHVLGVLQAELIAYRSFPMFTQGIKSLPEGERPRVLGVVLNMVQPAAMASVSVLQQACVHLPAAWLLETSIPRSNVFLEASEAGLPLRLLDDDRPPALSFLFETLASELVTRLEVAQPVRRPQRLLA